MKLGLGGFLVVEIPFFELDGLEHSSLSDEERDLKKRLQVATRTLEEMQNDLRTGEWSGVVAKLRDMELFKVHIGNFVKKIIQESTGLNDGKIGELTLAMDKLKSYASELHHKIDDGGTIHDEYTGGKEDAYLAYTLTASLINLISKKFKTYLDRKYGSK